MDDEKNILSLELERRRFDENTMVSIYHIGHSIVKVKSIFGNENYSDVLSRVVQRKLNIVKSQ